MTRRPCDRDPLVAVTALIPLAWLQLSCSGLRTSTGILHISCSELSAQSGGAKGAVQLTSGEILATRTEWRAREAAVVCSRSTDGGKHWQDISAIAIDRIGQDLGDGHLIPEEDAWYVADAIPNGSAAAIILLEHLWAIPLRNAIIDAGGIALADEWIHAKDLIAVGVAAAETD